jgi:hypothetical protein
VEEVVVVEVEQIALPVVEEVQQPISIPAVNSTWNEAPAPGPLDAWGSSHAPVAIGSGSGWADTVVAAPVHHQVPVEVETIEIAPVDIAPVAVAVQEVEQQQTAEESSFGAGPPGLAKRASVGRMDQVVGDRAQQQAMGVQFGSLSMYDGQNTQQVEQQQQSYVFHYRCHVKWN